MEEQSEEGEGGWVSGDSIYWEASLVQHCFRVASCLALLLRWSQVCVHDPQPQLRHRPHREGHGLVSGEVDGLASKVLLILTSSLVPPFRSPRRCRRPTRGRSRATAQCRRTWARCTASATASTPTCESLPPPPYSCHQMNNLKDAESPSQRI